MKIIILPLLLLLLSTLVLAQQEVDLNLLKEKLKVSQQELAETKKNFDVERNTLRDSIDKLKTERKLLLETISTSVGVVPNIVALEKIKAFETEIAASFKTNRLGRIRITLHNTSNGAKESQTTEFNSKHLVRFTNLSPNSSYNISAVIINSKGDETIYKLTPSDESKLNLKTNNITSNPSITSVQADPKNDAIGLVVKYGRPLAMAVDFYSVEDSTTMDYRLLKSVGSITLDDFKCPTDIPTSVALASERRFLLSGLASNRDYYFKIRAVDENGKVYEDNNFRRCKTKPAFPPFEFKDAVELKFSTLQSEISWEATSKPLSAEVKFSLPNKPEVKLQTQIENNKIKAVFDYNQIQQLVSGKDKSAVPLATITMKDANGTERSIKCKSYFILPNKEQVKNSQLSNADKESITKVSEIVTDGAKKKIDWTDIVKTGLPILLSIL